MEKDKDQPEAPRHHWWMWGDPSTVRNPIRERWEADRSRKAREKFEAFLREREKEETGK